MNRIVTSMSSLYVKGLYIAVPFTTCLGFSSGLIETITESRAEKLSSTALFNNVIGYTTLGALVGITYPITFPVLLHETMNK